MFLKVAVHVEPILAVCNKNIDFFDSSAKTDSAHPVFVLLDRDKMIEIVVDKNLKFQTIAHNWQTRFAVESANGEGLS